MLSFRAARPGSGTQEPQTIGQLCVNKRKISLLLEFFRRSTAHRVLLVTGPSGSGKSTALKVVASHLGLSQCSLQLSSHRSTFGELLDFLHRSLVAGPDSVFLVQELPAISSSPELTRRFSSLLGPVAAGCSEESSFLVFDVSDPELEPIVRRAFGEKCVAIEFNGCANTFLKKRLREAFPHTSDSLLGAVCECSDGDIRYATNILPLLRIAPPVRDLLVFSRDFESSLFSVLGKILYRKADCDLFSFLRGEELFLVNAYLGENAPSFYQGNLPVVSDVLDLISLQDHGLRESPLSYLPAFYLQRVAVATQEKKFFSFRRPQLFSASATPDAFWRCSNEDTQ